MSLKSILKKIFHIQNEDVYRTFRIFGIKCRFKSPKLVLIRKIETISKQNDAILRKEFEAKLTVLNEKLSILKEETGKFKIDIGDAKLRSYTISKAFTPFVMKYDCPLCDSSNIVVLGENPDFTDVIVAECKTCGFVFSILPAGFDVGEYYKEEYRQDRHEVISEGYILGQTKRAKAQYDFIRENIVEPLTGKKILEIGCSIGALLKLEDDGTNILVGYEPDLAMSEFASKNINGVIYKSSCDLTELENNAYDLIQLSHVFEHFEDPVSSIKELEKKLKSGGYLFIEIPNENIDSVYKSLGRKGVGHFSFFNPKTFEYLIENYTNLKILKQNTYTKTFDDWIYGKKGWESNKEIPNLGGIHYRVLLCKSEETNSIKKDASVMYRWRGGVIKSIMHNLPIRRAA